MPDPSPDPFSDRYSRQRRCRHIGDAGQARISESRVLIVGCGALGTHLAESLARAGVGSLRLVDRDLVEPSNLQRQIAFTENDARTRQPKALALARHLARVNSEIELDPRPEELDYRNASTLAEGVDLILDGTDNVPTRFLINDLSYQERKPWIYAGVIESQGAVQAFSGKDGPCLRCTLPELPPAGTLATCETAGVLGPAVAAIAGQQGVIALRILSGSDNKESGSEGLFARHIRFQLWNLEARTSRVRQDPECPVCSLGRFEFLSSSGSEQETRLCGRQAVQVRPRSETQLDFSQLETRLTGLGQIENRGLFLRLVVDDTVVTFFRDGRAIVDGLTDPVRARSLYARLLGE